MPVCICASVCIVSGGSLPCVMYILHCETCLCAFVQRAVFQVAGGVCSVQWQEGWAVCLCAFVHLLQCAVAGVGCKARGESVSGCQSLSSSHLKVRFSPLQARLGGELHLNS